MMFQPSARVLCLSACLAAVQGVGIGLHPVPAAVPRDLSCCSLISAALPGRVSYPSSSAYASSLASYWTTQEASLQPNCVVKPRDTNDVAVTIKVLRWLPLSDSCKVAIRGGGHTPWAGSANIDGGVTIDLSSLKAISVNRDKSVVSVGAGCVWGEVYKKAEAMGIAVIGGRGSSIGVSGLTLGGGISYFSARKGFASDNVDNFEVVLANGEVVNANAASNSDLFRALKGGSNNFGVVTRYDLRSFPQGKFWGGSIVYDDSASPALLKAFVNLNKDQGYDEYAALLQSHAYVSGGSFVAVTSVEYTKAVENPVTMQPFTMAQPQFSNTMRISNQSDFTDEFAALNPNGRRQVYITTTFKNDLKMVQYAYDTLKSLGPQLPASPGSSITITIQPVTPATTSKGASSGGNSLGLDDSRTALVLCLVSASWDNPGHDTAVNKLANQIKDRIVTESKRRGLWNRWVYLNYADKSQNPIEGYGTVNKLNLQAVSLKYDPLGFFQYRVPGGFKLFR